MRETYEEKVLRQANMLASVRVKHEYTQKEMAIKMGKSIGTIQNWESGLSVPSSIDVFKWYDVLGENPVQDLLMLMMPDEYMGLSNKSSNEDIRKSLVHYYKNVATDDEVRKHAYVKYGNTGSNPLAQSELNVAYNHLPLHLKVRHANAVLVDYKICELRDELVNKDYIKPNLDVLEDAIKKANDAIFDGKDAYI